ncbi:MAG: outer membrane beta-barrel protein [candidate division Zixibacteria bacterium]|nr:outer membrane beta-barrel protein [candidate division Zixibacteria bacterium]
MPATRSASTRAATVWAGWRVLALALAFLVAAAGTTQAQENPSGFYVGVFSGPGVLDVQSTDLDGFTGSQGVPGQTIEYDDTGFPSGVVAGRHFELGRVPIRFELGGAFVGLPSASRQMDPVGMDETATSELRWIGSVRMGVRKPLGRISVFLDGGVSVAGISNSFIDLDPGTDGRMQVDPDDSFDDQLTRVGWVVGTGIEMPVAGAWNIRFEGLYVNSGETEHQAPNRLGVNAGICGPAGLPSPCRYGIDQRFALLRLVLVRSLGR